MKKLIFTVVGVFSLFMLYGTYIRMTDPLSDARLKDGATIDYCESTATPETRYLCNRLKAGYRERYNREP
jgi:hypothetical protein